ncbi:hypothetical protein PCAR4_270020 [Paraburkholderia caribensis]|nr:hypothetical protein PCAR4_270020 [Paraburkholderia caribensis]
MRLLRFQGNVVWQDLASKSNRSIASSMIIIHAWFAALKSGVYGHAQRKCFCIIELNQYSIVAIQSHLKTA